MKIGGKTSVWQLRFHRKSSFLSNWNLFWDEFAAERLSPQNPLLECFSFRSASAQTFVTNLLADCRGYTEILFWWIGNKNYGIFYLFVKTGPLDCPPIQSFTVQFLQKFDWWILKSLLTFFWFVFSEHSPFRSANAIFWNIYTTNSLLEKITHGVSIDFHVIIWSWLDNTSCKNS